MQLTNPAPAPAIQIADFRLLQNSTTVIAGWGLVQAPVEGQNLQKVPMLQGANVYTQDGNYCASLDGAYQNFDSTRQICAGGDIVGTCKVSSRNKYNQQNKVNRVSTVELPMVRHRSVVVAAPVFCYYQ